MKHHYFKFLTLITTVVLSFSCTMSFSQQNNAMYFLHEIPQINKLNPAYQTSFKTYVGIPGLSSTDIAYGSNFLKYSSLIKPQGDSIFLDFEKALKKMGNKNNYFNFGVESDILSLGVRFKKTFITLDISTKLEIDKKVPKDLFTLASKGNAVFEGDEADLDDLLSGEIIAYGEIALGISHEVDEDLTIGAKFKYLKGMAHYKATHSEVGLYTSERGEYIDVNASYRINVAGPANLYFDENGALYTDSIDNDSINYVKGNRGYAIDLGMIYQVDDKWEVSASLLDIGFIRWNNNAYNLYDDGTYRFEGVENLFEGENVEDMNLDSILRETFEEVSGEEKAYTSWLSPKVYMGLRYRVNDNFNIGVLSRTQFTKGIIRQSLTLSANANLRRWLTSGISYSIAHRSVQNLGLSFGIKAGNLQFYVVNDNLLAVAFPQHAQYINTRFGFNLVFGNTNQIKEKDRLAAEEWQYIKSSSRERQKKGRLNNYIMKNPIGNDGVTNGKPYYPKKAPRGKKIKEVIETEK